MPSPLVHAAVGYAIYRICRLSLPQASCLRSRSLLPLVIASVGVSVAPDLDVVPGILMGNLERFHNSVMHTPIFGLVAALGVATVLWMSQEARFLTWFFLALLCYELHVLMDFLTCGRGVMVFWPYSLSRYQSPLKLFYGVHWSEGLFSVRHVWTFVTEMGFVVFLGILVGFLPKRR